MNKDHFSGIIDSINISYQRNPMIIKWGQFDNEEYWVQVGSRRPDVNTGEMGEGYGAKTSLGKSPNEDQIVKSVLGLSLRYVEHEMREGFVYNNRRIFDPHMSIANLFECSPELISGGGTMSPMSELQARVKMNAQSDKIIESLVRIFTRPECSLEVTTLENNDIYLSTIIKDYEDYQVLKGLKEFIQKFFIVDLVHEKIDKDDFLYLTIKPIN